MKQIKLVVGASVTVSVALLVAGGVRMARSFSAAAAARDQRDVEFSKLEGLFASKPFPDKGNADVARADTASLSAMRQAIGETLTAGNVPTENLSPSLFIQALQDALRNSLMAEAPIVDGARVVADSFGFGFDRYQGAGAPMPAGGDVPRLAQQLAIVKKLVAEVYAARVGSLRAVGREQFDAAPAAVEDASRRRRGERATSASGPATIRTDLYEAQHFTLEVSGREPAICELLNRLAAMDLFVVVSEVAFNKRGEDVLAAPPPDAGDGEGAAGGKVSTLPPSQRLMSGPEKDPLLDARIELDVYNFDIKGV